MSTNNEINEYVEYRLAEWANWYLRHNDLGLGYPKKTIEGRLIDEGGLLIRSTTPLGVLSNPEAEEIEQLVVELAQQNLRLAEVLREYYFAQGSTQRKAQLMGISATSFKANLCMAKQWLTGRLTVVWQEKECHGRHKKSMKMSVKSMT